jgi:hypothetical protein
MEMKIQRKVKVEHMQDLKVKTGARSVQSIDKGVSSLNPVQKWSALYDGKVVT